MHSCSHFRGLCMLSCMWTWHGLQTELLPAPCSCPFIWSVCMQTSFYNTTWSRPADTCVGSFKGGLKKGWCCSAVRCQAVFKCCLTLALVQPVECLFGFADSKLTPTNWQSTTRRTLPVAFVFCCLQKFLSPCLQSEFSFWFTSQQRGTVPCTACCRGM